MLCHLVYMSPPRDKTVKAADLRARLGTPAEGLTTRHPLRPLHQIPLPAPLDRPPDSLAALLEERRPIGR